MNMNEKEYSEYVKGKVKKSPVLKDCVMAFLYGGIICTIGQIFMNVYGGFGLEKEQASCAVSVTLIFLGALFTGLDIYPKIAKHAGAGTVVPITGFANAIVSPAIEARNEGFVLGVGAKIFTIAGPVILFGCIASVICGVVYFVMGLM